MKLDIEAMAEQAEKIADDKCQMPGECHPDWHDIYIEAFTRLIVERCAVVADSSGHHCSGATAHALFDCATNIRNLLED